MEATQMSLGRQMDKKVVRDTDLIPGLGRSPGGGHSNALQYSCLENPMDRGAWWAIVYGLQRVRQDWSNLAQHESIIGGESGKLFRALDKSIEILLAALSIFKTILDGVSHSWDRYKRIFRRNMSGPHRKSKLMIKSKSKTICLVKWSGFKKKNVWEHNTV